MSSRLNLFCAFAVAVGLALSGCGGGSTPPPPPPPVVSVSIAPSAAQTIDAGQTISFTATVTNDSSAKGVTWSLTGPGTLSNQTATSATYTGAVGTAKVTATSVADATKSASTNITVNAVSVAITPSAAQAIDVGQTIPFTATVTNDSGAKGVSWSQTGQGALSGQTTTGATYTGATGTATVTATSVADTTKSASTNITITAAPAFTTTTLPGAIVRTAYSGMLAVTGGAGVLTYSISVGNLPAGLNINASTGAITGTPTGPAGVVNFTAKVTDSSTAGAASATQALSIIVTSLTITNTSPLTSGNINAAYTDILQSSGGTGAVTWSILTGALPTGLNLDATTGAISGTPTVSGGFSITFQAADSGTPQQTASKAFALTIDGTKLEISTTSLLNPMIGEAYNQPVLFTGGTLPVTWSLANATILPAGLAQNATTGAIAGTPTAAGTTPFTVQLTDSGVPAQVVTKALTLTVTLANACGSGSESLLNGQYGISLTGFDSSGPAAMLGSVTVDGAGHITAGSEDINSVSGVQLNVPVTTASSSYSIGADHRGCLTLVAGGVTRIFRFSVSLITSGVAASGRVLEFDTTGANLAGTLDLQSAADFSNAVIQGKYAFRVKAPLSTAGGGFFAGVGVLTLSGTSVTGTGDFNVNGVVDGGTAGPLTFTAGTYNITGTGRGTLTFTSGSQPIHLIVYVLSRTQLLLMSSDPQSATNNLFAGFAGAQTGSPYSAASFSGPTVLFQSGQTGTGVGRSSQVDAGVLTLDGVSAFTLNGDQNSGGTPSTVTATGSYTVDSTTGRVLVTNTGSGSPAQIMYMVNPNEAYAMSTDTHVMTGDAEPQNSSSFTNASLAGTFGFANIDPVVASGPLATGVYTYDGNGNLTGTLDYNQAGFLSSANAVTGTYAVAKNGRVVTPPSGTTQNVSYIISTGKLVSFDYTSGNTSPTLVIIQK
jgi:hypothetical protein